MAKTTLTFTAISLESKKHQIKGVERLNHHRIRRESWVTATKKSGKKVAKHSSAERGTNTNTKKAVRPPRSVSCLLRSDPEEWHCKYCNRTGESDECGKSCHRAFKRENFLTDGKEVELRGPGPLGYGAFLSEPADPILKGDYIGEYVGELAPPGAGTPYTYEVPKVCSIDSQKAGNWTRFINSHCRPNVKAWGDSVGKRHILLLQALSDIEPGEEIRSCYGPGYFRALEMMCKCDTREGKHRARVMAERRRGRKTK